MKLLITNLLMMIGAILLCALWIPFAFIYTHIKFVAREIRRSDGSILANLSRYYHAIAFTLDQTGNAACKEPLNDWFTKDADSYRYGSPDQTVSHVTGVNERKLKLTFLGRLLAGILNAIDEGHTKKAADNPQYNE